MRKSVILPGVAVAGGLVGLLVRRVYLAHGFEAGTGLPISGALSLWAMVLVSAAVAAALLVLSRGKHRKFDQCYTGAFSPDTTPLLSGALAGAVLLAIGGFLALAAWAGSPRTLLGQRTMSIAWAGLGVLSLLAAAGIYFVAQKMRRGAPILTAWAVVPGFACCLWIMANYYQSWAEEPVLGQYLIPMLGALLSMIACFLVGGFAFGKARVTLTLTVCLAAGAFNIMALADGLPLADTALYLGMMFYLLSMAAGNDKLTRDEACQYLTRVGLCAKDYIDREVDASLSGGEVKRIEIATILARKSGLMIFDEPEAGIDLWSFAKLTETFKAIHQKREATLIVISHQERIIDLADEIVMIRDGKIAKHGPKDEIFPQILANTSAGCSYMSEGAR